MYRYIHVYMYLIRYMYMYVCLFETSQILGIGIAYSKNKLVDLLRSRRGFGCKKEDFSIFCSFFRPQIFYLDPTPERTAEKKSTRPTP